jgi:hypothetical protein
MSDPKETSTTAPTPLRTLNQLNELAQSASPGPWEWWDLKDDSGGSHDSLVDWNGGPGYFMDGKRHMGLGSNTAEFDFDGAVVLFNPGARGCTAADGDFMAAARTAVPQLVTEVYRLQDAAEEVIYAARSLQHLCTTGASIEAIQLLIRDLIETPLIQALPEGIINHVDGGVVNG